ncbi:MAG: two-component regulator propeller domain-containing protein [Bacteroidota bacterium]
MDKTDGLSSNSILSILKDSKGFMWFGTFDGLNKYDGANITVYKHDPRKKGSISNNRIQALFEDSKQNIWVGTTSGLNRYNPKKDEFTVYLYSDTIPNSVSHQNIKAIHEDENGFIWIGTIGGGLNRYNPKSDSFKRYRFQEKDPSSIGQDYILALSQTEKGFLWLGLAGRGIDLMDIKNEKFYHLKYQQQDQDGNFKNNVIRDMCPLKGKKLAVGTYGGFNVMNLDGVSIKEADTVSNQINTLFQHFEHGSGTGESQLSHSSIHSAVEDKRGNYWIATYGGGLNMYTPSTGEFKSYTAYRHQGISKSFNSIFNLYYDEDQQLLWVATAEQGVIKMNLSPKPFRMEDTDYEQINAIAEDDTYYWEGTYDHGILRRNKRTGEKLWIQEKENDGTSLASNYINDMEWDAKGNLWIATEHQGIDLLLKEDFERPRFTHFKYDKKDTFSLKNNAVQDLESLSDSILLAVSAYGVSFVNTVNHQVTRWNKSMSDTLDIGKSILGKALLMTNGELLIGGREQLFSLRSEQPFPRKYNIKSFAYNISDSTSISDNTVNDMIQDQQGRVWIGTDRGLNEYLSDEGKFIQYPEVWESRIMSLLSDKNGILWLGTESGILRYDPNSGGHHLFEVQREGLVLEMAKDSKKALKNGKFSFGIGNGNVSFYPDSIQIDRSVPKVQFTDLKIFGEGYVIGDQFKEISNNRTYLEEHVNHTDEVSLDYEDKLFTIHFAALDYRNPQKNEYRYRLLGWDDQWVKSGKIGKAQFTNLDPGEYTFQVISANADGIWSKIPKEMSIAIVPPWWMSSWFRVILAIVSLILLGIPFYLRIQKLKKDQLAQQQIIEAIADTQEEERQRISRDLHDSVGGQLVGVKQQLTGLLEKAPEVKTAISVLDETYDEVRRISHNMTPGTLMKFGLAAGIESIATMARSEETNINTFFHGIEGHFSKDYETNVFRIVQELLQNAMKHAEPSNINIGLTKRQKELSIMVQDDGIGFDSDNLSQNGGNGLRNVRYRVEKLMGTLFIDSSPEVGTQVNIELPIT